MTEIRIPKSHLANQRPAHPPWTDSLVIVGIIVVDLLMAAHMWGFL